MRRLSLALFIASLTGCPEECVDQFDCLKIESKLPLACDDGRCVVKTTLPMIPSFVVDSGVRTDAGSPVDGGESLRLGQYDARLSGGQLVPPLSTAASGSGGAVLRRTDAGTLQLLWSIFPTGTTVTSTSLGLAASAGRVPAQVVPLADGGAAIGSVALSEAQGLQLSSLRGSLILGSTTNPSGEVRGQLVPRGAFVGFTQFVQRRDGGGYGGGGQLVIETDGGLIPLAASYDFDWSESGPVAFAAVTQGAAPLLVLALNSTQTGAQAAFNPLVLASLRDAGVLVVGVGGDGGVIFTGDLALSFR